ncbi:hypothetical protein HanPI659440_Chr01g0025521 [Helianthus annuus]|nr:hypothetical protein HanPI659440_Chr01g0025521 [Helianthus annuus]
MGLYLVGLVVVLLRGLCESSQGSRSSCFILLDLDVTYEDACIKWLLTEILIVIISHLYFREIDLVVVLMII